MNKEELERVGYIVMNSQKMAGNNFRYNHIYEAFPNSTEGRFRINIDSSGDSNGWATEWFRLATPQEIEMYKQAGKPVDVTKYKMEKVVKMVKCTSINFGSLHKGVRIGETYRMEGDRIILDTGVFICSYGSKVYNACFRLCQKNEVEYVKSLHKSADYKKDKIYKVKKVIGELYICEGANNQTKAREYFEPSTKEAFDRQLKDETAIAYMKVGNTTVGYIENIRVTDKNKIVEIPIRKKGKRKVKMEVLESPRIKEL